jgi:hypothetical protein
LLSYWKVSIRVAEARSGFGCPSGTDAVLMVCGLVC